MIPALLAGLILLLPWMWRWFGVERDWYLLLMVGQAMIYGLVAPAFAVAREGAGVQDAYAIVMWQVALMFGVPLYLSYSAVRRWRSGAGSEPRFSPSRPAVIVDARRLGLLCGGVVGLSLTYLVVAVRHGLVFRRIGTTGLAAAQLELSLFELAPYRLFMQLGPWLIAVLIIVWRQLGASQVRARTVTAVSIWISGAVTGMHALINSRLALLLAAAFLAGFFTDKRFTRWLGGPLRQSLVVVVVCVGGYYFMDVAENIRAELGAGRTLANVQIFIPGGLQITTERENRSERFDGIAVVVKIRPSVERDGPALGAAWVGPIVASFAPVFPTDLGTRLKAAALTTSKSFLLLMYAGEAIEDVNSSLLVDAYGNLGVSGFAVAGLLVGALVAWASRALFVPVPGRRAVVALFVLWWVLPFEQEFGNILFGWEKLLPVLGVVAWCWPFRRDESPASMGATIHSAAG